MFVKSYNFISYLCHFIRPQRDVQSIDLPTAEGPKCWYEKMHRCITMLKKPVSPCEHGALKELMSWVCVLELFISSLWIMIACLWKHKKNSRTDSHSHEVSNRSTNLQTFRGWTFRCIWYYRSGVKGTCFGQCGKYAERYSTLRKSLLKHLSTARVQRRPAIWMMRWKGVPDNTTMKQATHCLKEVEAFLVGNKLKGNKNHLSMLCMVHVKNRRY